MFFNCWESKDKIKHRYNEMSDSYVSNAKGFCLRQATCFIKYYIDFTMVIIKRKLKLDRYVPNHYTDEVSLIDDFFGFEEELF